MFHNVVEEDFKVKTLCFREEIVYDGLIRTNDPPVNVAEISPWILLSCGRCLFALLLVSAPHHLVQP